jgi:hypothetical protein
VRPHRIRDRHARLQQDLYRGRQERKADPRGWQDGIIIGAPERHIQPDRPEARHGDIHVQLAREGFDALERHQGWAVERLLNRDLHHPTRRFQPEACTTVDQGRTAGVDGPTPDRDRGVAAHGAIAFLVGEQHRQIGTGMARFGRDDAIHARMPAGLQHQGAAQMIEPGQGVPPLLQNGGAHKGGIAALDDPHRLARRVHIDSPHDRIGHSIHPLQCAVDQRAGGDIRQGGADGFEDRNFIVGTAPGDGAGTKLGKRSGEGGGA